VRAAVFFPMVLSVTAPAALERMPEPPAAAASGELATLFTEQWEFRLAEDPLFATNAVDHRYGARVPSMTAADFARREAFARAMVRRLQAVDAAALSTSERVSRDMLVRELTHELAGYAHGTYRIPMNADSGFQTDFADIPNRMPFRTVADYESYLARLTAFPKLVDQEIALMREGLASGFSLSRSVLDGLDGTMLAHVVPDPEKSVFWEPFRSFPVGVPEAERARLAAEGRRAIRDSIVPAYRKLAEFMQAEYVSKARKTIGASELPRGREYYAHLVRYYTTLDVTPEQVHAIGLAEVVRIRAEMEAVMKKTGFSGSFAEFLTYLRTDPRFYAPTAEELLERACALSKKADGSLPGLFGRLPRLPYTVEPVPAHLAPKYTGGRYVEAPADGTRPGIYWVNTYALDKRPLYTLPALTLHEAVPGHHLQVALSQELSGLPQFRRFSDVGAFGEGWALYAEWLGREAGFYDDPYAEFGRLTYEMWRACRLVVDTGLHSMGWSRQQAIDYLVSNTALSVHECTTETDRYISWPGQALCYKMGELKIRELRRRAETKMGERFDVRGFHDAVLANGMVPLPVLEAQVDAWIASTAGLAAPTANGTAPASAPPTRKP
jgi:uncharacterized protein (DUF885 family)